MGLSNRPKDTRSFTAARPHRIFIALIGALGFFLSLGKAAVYKHIPAYYPDSVGAVGGLVGMIGGLGGFILPIAFGALNDLTGLWTSCFMLLFVVIAAVFARMRLAIRQAEGQGARAASALSQSHDYAAQQIAKAS